MMYTLMYSLNFVICIISAFDLLCKFDSQYKFGIDSSDTVQTIECNGGVGTVKIWTPERLQKLDEYRAKHGTKKAATQFKISESRIRQLLPSKKSAAEPFGGFPRAKYKAQ